MEYNHADKACELFAGGYNCAQAVLSAFCDVTGFTEETALMLSSSFGGGMGRLREVCGACSSMFMVAGLLYGYTEPNNDKVKAAHYRRIQQLAAEFRDKHRTIICNELLKSLSVDKSPVPEPRTEQYYKARPCIRFVRTAAEILDRYIAENPLDK